jgi:L-rhamnose mutarotase
MQRLAFKLKLNSGQEAEYKRRHDALWPELEQLLKETGIENYSIFLDENTLDLFGVLNIENPTKMDNLPNNPIMKKWWAYMADIMEVNEDNSPKSVSLKNVFHMQ